MLLIKAEQKFVRMSPIKIRFVAEPLRKIKSPMQVLTLLEYTQKKAAMPLAKVIKQAMANAKNSFGIAPEDLVIKELMINEGPVFKRGQPVSRGQFHPILKKTSHIRVVLESADKPKQAVKKVEAKNEETKVEEAKVVKPKKTAKKGSK